MSFKTVPPALITAKPPHNSELTWKCLAVFTPEDEIEERREDLVTFVYTDGLWSSAGMELWISGLSENGKRISFKWATMLLNKVGLWVTQDLFEPGSSFDEPLNYQDPEAGALQVELSPVAFTEAEAADHEAYAVQEGTPVYKIKWWSPLA